MTWGERDDDKAGDLPRRSRSVAAGGGDLRRDGGVMTKSSDPKWPGPTAEMFISPEFREIWDCIKSWDINVPAIYAGYMGATGNHVRAILDALAKARNA